MVVLKSEVAVASVASKASVEISVVEFRFALIVTSVVARGVIDVLEIASGPSSPVGSPVAEYWYPTSDKPSAEVSSPLLFNVN